MQTQSKKKKKKVEINFPSYKNPSSSPKRAYKECHVVLKTARKRKHCEQMSAHSFGLVSMETEEKAEKQRWTWVGRDTENKEQKKLFIKRGLPQTNQQRSQNQQICIPRQHFWAKWEHLNVQTQWAPRMLHQVFCNTKIKQIFFIIWQQPGT